MRVVWKYELTDMSQDVLMPEGADIVRFAFQVTTACAWAIVDPSRPKKARRLAVFGTGHDAIPDAAVYLGTAQQGPFVWHLFELV